jgi:putative phosphoribosyl transferase
MQFQNRADAGHMLAQKLTTYANRPDVLVLGLPRGGVPVAYQIARTLHVALDIFIVRKLGAPDEPELAIGAIASGGVQVFNQNVLAWLDLSGEMITKIIEKEQEELARRERSYRDKRSPLNVHNKIVIIVDDGLATGSTMQAAVQALKQQRPARLVIAVPVAPPEIYEDFKNLVDEVVCVITPPNMHAIGAWYDDFSQTSDEEVRNLLAHATQISPEQPPFIPQATR